MDKREENNEEYEWGIPDGPPPRLDLPFAKKRKKEAGEWIYDNRETICITVIVYLLAAIVIVSSKIIISPKDVDPAVIVEFQDMEQMQRLEEELKRAEELNKLLNEIYPDYGSVRNAISNENATDGEQQRMSAETRELFERSDEVLKDMDRNSAEYQQMLAELVVEHSEVGTGKESKDAKINASVTVSYSLASPVRHSVRLPVPAYKCAGGGTVVIGIVVSRNGDVISANVDNSRSSSDECMTKAAMGTAMRSRFNVDSSAPDRHAGSITYVFVPQ